MNLSFPQLMFASIGALLIYAAVTGKMPNTVVKEHLGNAGGLNINPMKTGQASTDGSSGHNMDVGGTQFAPAPAASGSGRSVHQVYP